MSKENKMMAEVNKEKDNSRVVAGINIDKLVKKAQEVFKKNEGGLAKQLSTGASIIRPNEDKDYVLWTAGDHWKQITHMAGIPFGRIIQIAGAQNSGKSTHALCFMKMAQDQGTLVLYWDAERKFSKERFDKKIGGNSDQLCVVDTNSIIDGAKAVSAFIHAAKEMNPEVKILIVIDSIGALIPSTENGETEDFSKQPGVAAKENSYMIKKISKLSNKYRNTETGEETIATLLINQTYASIGMMGGGGQINKGGGEIQYLSSVIIQLTRKKDLVRVKDGEKYKYGITSRMKVTKNHLAEADEQIAEMDICVSADGIRLSKDVSGYADLISDDDGDE